MRFSSVAIATLFAALFVAGCSAATEGAETPAAGGTGGQPGNNGGVGGIAALATGQTATGLAVDGSSIYWASVSDKGDSVMKASIYGGDPVVLSSANNPGRITLDAAVVYWVENGTAIRYVPKWGGRTRTLTAGHDIGTSLLADKAALYFMGERGGIMKVNKLNGDVALLVTGQNMACGWGSYNGMTQDSEHVYWANCDHEIMKVPKLGGPATRVAYVGEGHRATELAVDAHSIYWLDSIVYPPNTRIHDFAQAVMKAPLYGGRAMVLVSREHPVLDFVIDGANLFWSTQETGWFGVQQPTLIEKVPLAGGKPFQWVAFQGVSGARELVSDSRTIYFTLDDGRIMRVSKQIKLIKPTGR